MLVVKSSELFYNINNIIFLITTKVAKTISKIRNKQSKEYLNMKCSTNEKHIYIRQK